jgi:transcriptional regulator with XRE-family HTH domain
MYIARVMHLSDYMKAKNLSDQQVAKEIGCSRATVSRIRRRKVRPDWARIEKLKEFTGGEVTADDFLLKEAAE